MTAARRPSGLAAALAALAASAPLSGAPAEEGRRAEPVAPLASVLSDEDYPAAAVRSGEQGSVSFRLSIDVDGRVSGCEVLVSSNSAPLDSTTCRLMTTRVRFHPAADAAGKPVADSFESRIVWRLPASPGGRIDLPRRPSVAVGLWSSCADGEAAKLALSTLGAAEIADRAFRACTGLEERIVGEIAEAKIESFDARRYVQALKDDFTTRLGPRLEQVRSELGPQGK